MTATKPGPRIAVAMALASCLAGVLGGYATVFSPNTQLACPSGQQEYSGLVTNVSGMGVGGVVVQLHATSGYPADAGEAVTSPLGSWSMTLNGCPHAANFFWASDTDGPMLSSTEGKPLQRTATVIVDVSEQSVSLPWVREFPDDPNVSINFDMTGSVLVEAVANTSGQLSTRFLPRTAADEPGTSTILWGNFTANRSVPYLLVWEAGKGYRVRDVNGSTVTYLVLRPGSNFRLQDTADYMTRDEALEMDRRSGIYPFVSIAPLGVDNHTLTFRRSPGQWVVDLTILGAHVSLNFSLSDTLVQIVTVSLANQSPIDQCFVRFGAEMEQHLWYYGNGTCPLS